MNPNVWIVGNDTGVSSRTLWAAMMGVIDKSTRCGYQYDVPHDNGDFGRCFNLIILIPEWRKRLNEVPILLPAWKPYIDHWDEMEKLYMKQKSGDEKAGSKLYKLMVRLGDESKILDGWTKTGYGWERKEDG